MKKLKLACVTPFLKRDYLCEMVLEGFHTLGHQLVVSDPGNGFLDVPATDDEWVKAANNCDVVIAFFGQVRGNSPPRHFLVDRVNLPRERKIYVDGSEWRFDGWEQGDQAIASLKDPSRRRGEPWLNEPMLKKCGHYFKRECYPEDMERGIVPLPFAMCQRHIQTIDVSKDIDVFCSFGHIKTGLRKEAIEVVEHFKRTSSLNIVVKSGMTQNEYQDHLRRSRIVVDAFGGGDTTDRFWEGIGARACVLYQRYNIVMPHPFEDWRHAVSWSSKEELSNHLHRLVYGSEAEDIGFNGREHAFRYHQATDRAQQILQSIVT